MTKNVVVLGKGKLAIRVAQWFLKHRGYKLVTIVPVMPEPTWTNSLTKWAKKNQLAVIETGHYKDVPNTISIDLAVSVTYDKIIKLPFINRCKRIINIHNGPLPKYRGVSPINWALKNNETIHGVTIHEITPGIDDGPIWSQVKFSVYPETDEVKDVYQRCLAFGWTLFKETIPLLDKLTPQPQNNDEATYYDLSQNSLLAERRFFTKKLSSK
jgi:methionyl-tRNA formyltransferase